MVKATQISHKYNDNFLFKDISFESRHAHPIAITGTNGSGKSTMLKIIAGLLKPTLGSIDSSDNYNICYVAPYVNLYDELTLVQHHNLIKKTAFDIKEAEYWQIEDFIDKPIGSFSSGMKQRAKYYLAFVDTELSNNLVLIDEPYSNLDRLGIDRVERRISSLTNDNFLFIASNSRAEYDYVAKVLIEL